VANDACRLVQRFSRDWMNTGRRPAGICGACLLLAARMNNFRRSLAEVVQVVKIADVTVRKRLEEFKQTPTSALSVQDFRSIWLEEYTDPPAFVEGQKREREKTAKLTEAADDDLEGAPEDEGRAKLKRKKGKQKADSPAEAPTLFESEVVDPTIMAEINAGLLSADGTLVAQECDELDRQRMQFSTETSLEGLDEDELDAFLLTPDEVKEKERLWIAMNKDYLQQVAGASRARSASQG
jgi:transcription factor IIIB subunit 2